MKQKLTLTELEERAANTRHRLLSRQKERYELAKELGFSGIEAGILQHKSRETIIRLAKERNQSSPPLP